MDTSTPAPSMYVGIDVAKAHLDLAFGGDAPPERIAYTAEALQALLVRLQGLSAVQVIVEATGGLELRLMVELWAAQIAVARINPERVRAFAKASGQLAKTDALDARLLAQFGAALRPAATPLPAPDTQALAALVGRRRQLVDMRTMEHNRLLSAVQTLQPGIQHHLAWLDDEIAALEHDISDFIQRTPAWAAKDAVLQSVPGIGPITAAPSWPPCPSWAPWIARSSQRWSAWRPSITTAATRGANAMCRAVATLSAASCTWRRWPPSAIIRRSRSFMTTSLPPAKRRRSPLSPVCASC